MNEIWEKNKKIILFVAVPVVGIFFLLLMNQRGADGETTSRGASINTSLPEKKDSVYKSKGDAYDAQKAEEDKKKEQKAAYGLDDKLNLNLAKPEPDPVDPSKANQDLAKSALDLSAESKSQTQARPVSSQAQQAPANVDRQLEDIEKKSGMRSHKVSEHSGSGLRSSALAVQLPAVAPDERGFRNLSMGEGGSSGSSGAPAKSSIKGTIMRSVNLEGGQNVAIRTMESATIGGIYIPRNTILTGITQSNDGRLLIAVSGAQIDGQVADINLSVYDQDGIEGIRAPTSAVGGSAKQSVDDQLANVDNTGSTSSIMGIATSAGSSLVKAARSGSKTHIAEGYRVILRIKQ